MKSAFWRLASPLFDEGGGGAANSDASGAGAAGTSGGSVGSSASTTTPGTSAAPGAAATSQPSGFTYKEDRSSWIPPHVQRRYVSEAQQARAELEITKRQIAALTGVRHEATRDPETERIRGELLKVAPELKGLLENAEALSKLAGVDLNAITERADAASRAHWVGRGNQTLQSFEDKVRTELGDLTPKAMSRLAYAFVNEIGSDPQLAARYEAGDPRIVDEFIADYKGSVLDPYSKRTASASASNLVAARNLPRGGGGSAVHGNAKPTLKPSDPNYHKAAYARFNQG